MKPENIQKAAVACRELRQLESHQANVQAVSTEDLPQDQFDKQASYLLDLKKVIQRKKKDIEEL